MAGRQFHLAVARISFGAASLKVAASFFFLFRKEFSLPCGDIAAVYKYEAFVFSRGVLIRHDTPNVPPYLLFWTKESDPIFAQGAEHGIPVE